MGLISFALDLIHGMDVSIPHDLLQCFEFAHRLLFAVAVAQTLVVVQGLQSYTRVDRRIQAQQSAKLSTVSAKLALHVASGTL